MYDTTDGVINKKKLKKELTLMLLCMLPFVAAAVIAFVLRAEPVCIAATALAGCVAVFILDLRVAPVARYGAFLKEIQSGLSRETVGALVRVNPDPVYQDGVNSVELFINIYEDMSEEGERRFLLDCAKPLDSSLMGQDVVITSHGSYVLSIEKVGA